MAPSIVLLLLLASACVHAGEPKADPATASNVVVLVANDGLPDADIFAVHDGIRFRVGFVHSNTTVALHVPVGALEIGNDLNLVVHQIGESRDYVAGTVHVAGDEVAELDIAPAVQFSTLWVRSR